VSLAPTTAVAIAGVPAVRSAHVVWAGWRRRAQPQSRVHAGATGMRPGWPFRR